MTQKLEDLWERFNAADPLELPESADGVDLDMLVGDAVECIGVFMATGSIDQTRRGTLRACDAELRALIPHVDGPVAVYLGEVAAMATEVLIRVDRSRPGWLG